MNFSYNWLMNQDKNNKVKIPPKEKEKNEPFDRPNKDKRKDIDIEDSEDKLKENFPTTDKDKNKKIKT